MDLRLVSISPDGKIVAVTFFTASLISPTAGHCTYDFDQHECIHNVFCEFEYDLRFYTYAYGQNHHYACWHHHKAREYSGKNYLPVHVRFNNFLSNVKLRGTYGCHVITTLDISGNKRGFYPDLPYMDNLETLNMSSNSLTVAKLSNSDELVSLMSLDYSHNVISNIEVNSNESPYKKLRKLNLAYNVLTSIPDGIFEPFHKMESLDLSYNLINDINILTFKGLKKLLYLNLSHNKISDLKSSLMRFNNLEELNLSFNHIQNITRSNFQTLSYLKMLDLKCNEILSLDNNVFNNMRLLKTLDISMNKLESLDNEAFLNATNIENINLSQNNIKFLQRNLFRGKTIIKFSIKGNTMEGALINGTFEGLNLVTELDLSNQSLTTIEDFAFNGLEMLNLLLLNDNNITLIFKKAFKTLRNLNTLDLSNNQITNIEFDIYDLQNLTYLFLKNNYIFHIKTDFFRNLNVLQFLDLSNNNINALKPEFFKDLNKLVFLKLSNNSISGVIEDRTFEGLTLLPSLDISGTLLTGINNKSFNGMTHMQDLNSSHCRIKVLQFNAFANTGAIEILDLSFNELNFFDVNTTDLFNLTTLVLNNNLITSISSNSLNGLQKLEKVILSYNNIENIQEEAFRYQKNLTILELSCNRALKFNASLHQCQYLTSLLLTGTKTNSFSNIGNTTVTNVDLSYSKLINITMLELRHLDMEHLVLSNNEIVSVELGAFSNLSRLSKLDLSYNKISFIQPNVFEDNKNLYLLNVSHNVLTTVSYGIFRGLRYLNTIDMSYNVIESLESERFYELKSLKTLIVDNNQIDYVDAAEFSNINYLSIGGNPLPCHILVNLKKTKFRPTVTAIIKDHSNENVDGVTCNKGITKISKTERTLKNDTVLLEIRDILRNLSSKMPIENQNAQTENYVNEYLANFTSNIKKIGDDLQSSIVVSDNHTDHLLEKIVNILNSYNTEERLTLDNNTIISMMNYFKYMIQDLVNIKIKKLYEKTPRNSSSVDVYKDNIAYVTIAPDQNTLLTVPGPGSKSFTFMEVCVAMILVILIGFMLYKVFTSVVYFCYPNSRYGIRNLSDDLENSTL